MPQPAEKPAQLIRHFGTLQATALNMSNMIGIGPFITIPLLMSAMGGPQALLGWLIAILIVIPDGLVWSELGASMPGSGGTYVYLRESFGRNKYGRLMAFLFIWQFILSGPLEIASGYIGFSKYFGYLWPGMSWGNEKTVCLAIGIINIILLYRRITHLGKLTISLWIGTLLTVGVVIVTGIFNFDSHRAFDFPPEAFKLSSRFFTGIGAAATIGIYDYLGYYDICYIGDEVKNPGKTIPRSIIISVIAVAIIYIAINISVIGVVPWREFVPAEQTKPVSDFVVSIFMEKIYGTRIAAIFTVMILWTAFGSCFALLLGYSRIPYAAAKDGYFFKAFSHVNSRGNFPDIALVVIGLIAIICSFFSLDVVISALIVTRILVQFIGQIVAVELLRRQQPELPRPFRIWFYPLPSCIALGGWLFIFATSGWQIIGFGLFTLLLGLILFLAWSWRNKSWPFAFSPNA